MKKTTKVQQTNCVSDEGSDSEQQSATTRKTSLPKRLPRRSAQEIVNSMKGSDDLTSTSIKLDRLRRSPPSSEKSTHSLPWLKELTDGEETDDLPDLKTVLPKLNNRPSAKRTRDPTPDNDNDLDDGPMKKAKASSPDSQPPAPAELREPTTRSRSATVLKSSSRILSPKRATTRILASPEPSSESSQMEAASNVKSSKQALFRPPSVDTSDMIPSKVENSSDTEVSEVDEVQQDTKDWMEDNVEILD